MMIWTENRANARFSSTFYLLLPPSISPLALNSSHNSFNRLLGAGPPCSVFRVTERSDDHVYACWERPPPVAVSLGNFIISLPHVFSQYFITTSGWMISCFLLCNHLCSHKATGAVVRSAIVPLQGLPSK